MAAIVSINTFRVRVCVPIWFQEPGEKEIHIRLRLNCVLVIRRDQFTLDTFTIGDPDVGPFLFETFRPPIIGPIQNQVTKFELEIVWVTF